MYIVFWDAEMQKFHELTYTGHLLATALAGSFLFRCVLESWNSKHPFWELPGLILLLGGKVAVCFSSHNLAVVDWSPHGLHWRTMLCSQQLGGSPSPQPAITHFLSVSKSFRPPWPVAAKVLESHLPSPSKMPKKCIKIWLWNPILAPNKATRMVMSLQFTWISTHLESCPSFQRGSASENVAAAVHLGLASPESGIASARWFPLPRSNYNRAGTANT